MNTKNTEDDYTIITSTVEAIDACLYYECEDFLHTRCNQNTAIDMTRCVMQNDEVVYLLEVFFADGEQHATGTQPFPYGDRMRAIAFTDVDIAYATFLKFVREFTDY